MLRIGEFSRVCKLTVKTLRYYSDINLLKPYDIDKSSGYRYYSPGQIAEVAKIGRFKEMGFSLDEIKKILKEPPSKDKLRVILLQQLAVSKTELRLANDRISTIGKFMESLAKDQKMEKVTITSIPQVLVASKRVTLPTYDALYEICPAMGQTMKEHGARCANPPYCFNIYHDKEHRETNIDVEICEAVEKLLKDGDGIVYKKMDGIDKVAVIKHRGNYDMLSESYSVIFQWIEENGWEQSDLERESYIDGIWNKDNPEDWLTEIQIPVRVVPTS